MAGVPPAAGTAPAEERYAVAVAPSSPPTVPVTATATAAAGDRGIGAGATSAMNASAALGGGAADVFSALGGGGGGAVSGGGGGHIVGVGSSPLSFDSSPLASAMGGLQRTPFAGALPTATPSVPSDALAGGSLVGDHGQGEAQRSLGGDDGYKEKGQGGRGEEEDFGDFAGAQEGSSAERDPPPLRPSLEDDDDGFGDFSSAPADGKPTETASASTLAATEAATATSAGAEGAPPGPTAAADPWLDPAAARPPVAGGGGRGAGVVDGDAWMMGGVEGGVTALAGGSKDKDGLDSLIKNNLQAATSGPVHLAAMVGRFFVPRLRR